LGSTSILVDCEPREEVAEDATGRDADTKVKALGGIQTSKLEKVAGVPKNKDDANKMLAEKNTSRNTATDQVRALKALENARLFVLCVSQVTGSHGGDLHFHLFVLSPQLLHGLFSLLVSTPAHKIPWRFGCEPETRQEEDNEEKLQKKWRTVCPSIFTFTEGLDGSVREELAECDSEVDASGGDTTQDYGCNLRG
jgi:hypothetical protein